jgi:hypothetical protein
MSAQRTIRRILSDWLSSTESSSAIREKSSASNRVIAVILWTPMYGCITISRRFGRPGKGRVLVLEDRGHTWTN